MKKAKIIVALGLLTFSLSGCANDRLVYGNIPFHDDPCNGVV